jgi:hypothetical protein
MDQYARKHIFCRGFYYCYDGSFTREWINTSLNNQALTLAPVNLLLFSLPGAGGVSEVQKRWCARLILLDPCKHVTIWKKYGARVITVNLQNVAGLICVFIWVWIYRKLPVFYEDIFQQR